MTFDEYRRLLDLGDSQLFLNYAATAPISKTTAARVKSEIDLMTRPLGTHFYETLNEIENARRLVAELIHTNPKNLAFTLNTSTAISTVALSVNLKAGDIVLVPDNEFPSNYFPWLNLRNKGVICKTFKVNEQLPLVEDLETQDLTGVKLISISAVSYETGRLYELEEFVRFCRANNILSCLDSIQAIGSTPFDLDKIGPDFMCSAAQKWLMGPVGCGFLYARPELLDSLAIPYVGWTSHKFPEYMSLDSLEFPDEMTRFEPGLPNYLPVIGAASSLTELNAVGWDNIYSAIRTNSEYLRASLKSAGFRLLADGDNQFSGITSFYQPDGFSSRSVGELYDKEGIKVTTRNGYVRVSPQFFAERQELDRFLNATEAIFKTRRKDAIEYPLSNAATTEKTAPGRILVLGAAGNLGSRLAGLLAKQNRDLHLVSKDPDKLGTLAAVLRGDNGSIDIQTSAVDFSSAELAEAFIHDLSEHGAGQYHALINCCSEFEVDLFHQLPENSLQHSLMVNVEVPGRLIHLFLNKLKSPDAHGLMNIVSSTGRCGSPLLSNYGSTHAALWTLGETLSREWADTDLAITTFVAPAMHSPLQKLMGRTALRYFRISGGFDYEDPDKVANQALSAFWNAETVHIGKPSRLKLWTNALFPKLISKKTRKVWKQDRA